MLRRRYNGNGLPALHPDLSTWSCPCHTGVPLLPLAASNHHRAVKRFYGKPDCGFTCGRRNLAAIASSDATPGKVVCINKLGPASYGVSPARRRPRCRACVHPACVWEPTAGAALALPQLRAVVAAYATVLTVFP